MARTSIATDNFNRTAPLGSNWANLNNFGGGDVSITGSIKFYNNVSGGENNRAAARWVGAGTFSNDQYSKITIVDLQFQSSAYAVGVIVRASADVDGARDMYFFEVESNSGGPNYTTRLGKIVDGTTTVLNSASQAWSTGDTVEIEVVGTTLTAFRNGTALGGAWTQTDSSLSTGNPGITAGGDSNNTGDDWDGGDVTAGGGTPIIPGRRIYIMP